MKIGIVGGGSIGLLFAFYLNQYHEVILYVRSQVQKKQLEEEGLILTKHGDTYRTVVRVEPVSEWGKEKLDLSVICVKQYHLDRLLKDCPKSHPLLFIQNGMGHLKWLAELESELILVASIEHGSYRDSENCVSHTGEGITRVAIYKGEGGEFTRRLIAPFADIFPFVMEDDYREMLLRKLIVNAIINPLTAILKVPNGMLLENPFYFKIMNQLFAEIKEILQLDRAEEYFENVLNVCKKTKNNRSSMLKDLDERRPTEVDAILGFLIEEARKINNEAPLVHTFYNCIKGSELAGEGN